MKIASFLGEKGGVGKTTNAHATAHGLSMLGIPAAYLMTDKRELPSDEHRVYTVIDGRTVSQLEQAVAADSIAVRCRIRHERCPLFARRTN